MHQDLDYSSAMLRIDVRTDVVISSITLWNDNLSAGPLFVHEDQLMDADVSIGSVDTTTGCQISSFSAASKAGFEGRALACGSKGSIVMMSFPNILTSGRKGKFAVKLCTVPFVKQEVSNAVVWLQIQGGG